MEFDGIEDLAQLDDTPRCWFQASIPRQLPCRPCADTVHALHTFLIAPSNVSPRSWM